ncbi:MAG: XRE family transcriptional regulator [Comamonadaceae bacterium]|nr:MAG: XRE family transcriptional regulator [Comamonadaceae bacterium]
MIDKSSVKTVMPLGVVPYNTLVGKAIEAMRSKAGVTQTNMAAALEIGQSAYSKLESGHAAMTIAQLRVIAMQLSCDPHKILKEADDLAKQLQVSGVDVPAKKDETNKAALLVGLGLLLALMSKG